MDRSLRVKCSFRRETTVPKDEVQRQGSRIIKVLPTTEHDDEEYPPSFLTEEDEKLIQMPVVTVCSTSERDVVRQFRPMRKVEMPTRRDPVEPKAEPVSVQTVAKTAVLCHVGNLKVFENMLQTYPLFFSTDLFVSCSTADMKDRVCTLTSPKHVIVTGNQGCDIGGFLLLLKQLCSAEEYDLYIMIHTKTDPVWRNGMLQPLYNLFLSRSWPSSSSRPLIYAAGKYVRQNYKLVNRQYIKDIIMRNIPSYTKAVDEFVDHYLAREFFDQDIRDANIFQGLEPNVSFYRAYEEDVTSIDHWHRSGIHEFHRISNYHYIKKFSQRNSNFVAGTCFAFNIHYLRLLTKFNLKNEFDRLEPTYVKNNVPRRIHAWEYFFCLLCYLFSGDIIVAETCQPRPIRQPLTLRSLIHKPLQKARIAFFMIPPPNPPICGGYKTLLRYIRHLNNKGHVLDIYFGIAWSDAEVKNNMSYDHFGEPTCRNWFHHSLNHYIEILQNYNVIDIHKNNFYVGLRLQRHYDVAVANAWQVSHAAHLNSNMASRLAYIIQDREELFYPGNTSMQSRVIESRRPAFYYFCLSRYLTKYLSGTLKNVSGTVLTFDPSIYQNRGKERRNAVAIAYYAHKTGRMPDLTRAIIRKLLHAKIECHTFPDTFESNSPYLTNHGILTETKLDELYNLCKVGIIFSNTNPSRIGFEMCASGLHVIEYDSPYTLLDCVRPHFTLIRNAAGICETITDLFKTPPSKKEEYYRTHKSAVEMADMERFMQTLL